MENDLKTWIANAEQAGACDAAISTLKKLTLEEILAHEYAPFWACWYAREVVCGRFPEGETVIAKNAFSSYMYARDMIKGRFEAGEATIATNARYSYLYAREVIKGRFPEGEAAIATDAIYIYLYISDVIKGRFEAGEAAIAMNEGLWSRYKSLYF